MSLLAKTGIVMAGRLPESLLCILKAMARMIPQMMMYTLSDDSAQAAVFTMNTGSPARQKRREGKRRNTPVWLV